jgi:Fe-S-cluster containining protein
VKPLKIESPRSVGVEALSRKACTCEECIGACKNTPGWFLPGEAEKAAAALGMTYGDFRELLIAEYWGNGEDAPPTFVLSPRKKEVDRDRAVASFAFGAKPDRCIFLDANDRCRIHSAKPFECAVTLGCEPLPELPGYQNLRHYIAEQWKKDGSEQHHEQPAITILDVLEFHLARLDAVLGQRPRRGVIPMTGLVLALGAAMQIMDLFWWMRP